MVYIPLLLSWLLLILLVMAVDPEVVRSAGLPNSYLPFFILTAIAFGWLVGIVRRKPLAGVLWGISLSGYLYLRMLGLGQWWNGLLIIAFIGLVEYYWRDGQKNDIV